ncbi:MAG: substrate-binding domain-containing protein [Devosia sp.]
MDSRRTATIKTVAQALMISPSTVSRALRGDPQVTAKTRLKIIETAERLGYRRNVQGANLRTGRTLTLCAILATPPTQEFGDPAAMHLIQGLNAGLEGSEFKVVIRPVDSAEMRFEAVREAAESGRFDGLVLDHTEPQDRAALYLLEKKAKFITFGRTELFSEHPYLDIDNEQAAFEATEHLLAGGHHRIALIGPPEHFLFSRQRLRGYRRALVAAGVAYDPALVAELSIGANRVRQAVLDLLALADRPTAFVTSNEMATLGAISAARSLPRDEFDRLGFVSRDGTNLFDYFETPVSSCYYPLIEVGEALSRALVEAVDGAPVSELQMVEQARLVVRPAKVAGP